MLHNIPWNSIVHRPLRWKQGLPLTLKSVLLSLDCKHKYFKAVLANWQMGKTLSPTVGPLSFFYADFLSLRVLINKGPCQFPTLGFVVQKWNLVKSFVSEPFWYIYLSLIRNSEEETVFTWKRGHLFDFAAAVAIYDLVLSNPLARVTKVTNKSTKKW